ncbi:MAG TPA: ATP-binding protein [Candidatus Competibacteraceae bacterium]|nr:ATP-binding protein [Candidatus Competibacteraceae bacterium]
MSLRNRLLIGYGAVLAIVLAGFCITFAGVWSLGGLTRNIVEDNYQSILAAERMTQALQRQQLAILQELLTQKPDLAEDLERAHQQFVTWLERARNSVSLGGEPALIEAIAGEYAKLRERVEDRSRWAATLPWENGVPEAFQAVVQACEALRTLNLEAMREASRRSQQEARTTLGALAGVALVTLLMGLGVSINLSRRLSEPLEQMVEAAGRIARGDYQVNIAGSPIEELAALARQFNRMAEALRQFRAMDLERVLHEQRQSEAVLASIDDGLVIFAEDGRIERMNPVAQRQLGLAGRDCTGQRLGEVLGEAALDALVARCLGLGGDEPAGAQELSVGEGDGRRFLAYSVMPIVGSGERRQGAVLVLRDITAHKAFEQMRTEFVVRASHELRTPLTSLSMGIGMLVERAPFAPHSRERELLDTVYEELQRLLRLVNDLFDLSRFQAGKQSLERVPCEPAALLQAARQRFALHAADQGVELTLELQPPLPRVLVDETHFARLLDNLIGNALRHTPAGGRVILGARRAGSRLEIRVADTGPGIDFAQQARVFEPFVQVGGGNSGGAGLGLAICKEIAQHHGGTLTLSSWPGRGATFVVTLPV